MTVELQQGLEREQYCYLETRGRKSERPHEIEIWFAADGHTLYMLAGGRDRADWVRNLREFPQVRLRVGRVTYDGTAETIEGSEEDPVVRRMLEAKYQGWSEVQPMSRWAQESLPVAVRLSELAL